MKIFTKNSLTTAVVVLLVISLIGLVNVFAATTPSLGAAASYGILASRFINTSASTTINGDVGFTTGPAQAPLGTHTFYGSGYPYSTAGTDQGSALATGLATQPCTFTFIDATINLSSEDGTGGIGTTTPISAGVYSPGVYCTQATQAASIEAGGITLQGAGTYIFRILGALTSADGADVTLTGASACDVFWTPTGATSLGPNNTFAGTVIDDADITVGGTTTWSGRALAFGGDVTTGTAVNITVPATCSAGATPLSGSNLGTVTVVKTVINDNGGTKVVADFPLFVNGTLVGSGVTNNFPGAGLNVVTETTDPNYTRTFSGDCDLNGLVSSGGTKVCIVTNNDIGAPLVPPVPPLIDVVKTANPLALPAGPGPVIYTYTARNIGTVPMTNVTMVGDTCSPVILVSGDTNADAKLDVNETWVHTCSTTLSATHTNTIVATGWANGISAVDIASATVVVGAPIVPPLIHVTKIPSPLTLLAGGGMVTYTNKVTNPGLVALSNVRLTDNKCTVVSYVSGDTDGDLMLDTAETWTYTCSMNLTQTTVNTVIATGEANGLTARDFALATVVVAAPKLPATGIDPNDKNNAWGIVALVGILTVSTLSFTRKKQLTN